MDPEVVGEARGVDPMAVGEAPAWTQWWWRRHGVEADAEEERERGVNPVTIREAVGVDLMAVREAGGGRGAGGRAGGGEMVPTRLGFKGKPCY
jgi:hypothetical protein